MKKCRYHGTEYKKTVTNTMNNSFSKTKDESTLDKVTQQLRTLIMNGELMPGSMLPPERKLAEKFGVGRLMIRDAIKKLEFYGIVKTQPQSGTKIKGMGALALEGLISDALHIGETDYESLVDTRVLLEIASAGKAATRRTEEDIIEIQNALDAYEAKILSDLPAQEEDYLLHFAIAKVSGNSVLNLLLRIITPDILKNYTKPYTSIEGRELDILNEHREIVNQIIAQNAKGASRAMRNHLRINSGSSLFYAD